MLRRLGVPEENQQIFQSHAAALEEAKRGKGVALALSVRGRPGPGRRAGWCGCRAGTARPRASGTRMTLPDAQPAAGRGRADPLRHHAAGHPGDAARRRRRRRPLPPVDPRHPLELRPHRSDTGRRAATSASASDARRCRPAAARRSTAARRPSPPTRGAKPGAAGARVHPDHPVGPPPQPGHRRGQLLGRVAVPAVRADDHDRAAHGVAVVRGEQRAQVGRDPGAAEPVGHRVAGLRRSPPRPSGARSTGVSRVSVGGEREHLGVGRDRASARIRCRYAVACGLHRLADVAQHDHPARPAHRRGPHQLDRLPAGAPGPGHRRPQRDPAPGRVRRVPPRPPGRPVPQRGLAATRPSSASWPASSSLERPSASASSGARPALRARPSVARRRPRASSHRRRQRRPGQPPRRPRRRRVPGRGSGRRGASPGAAPGGPAARVHGRGPRVEDRGEDRVEGREVGVPADQGDPGRPVERGRGSGGATPSARTKSSTRSARPARRRAQPGRERHRERGPVDPAQQRGRPAASAPPAGRRVAELRLASGDRRSSRSSGVLAMAPRVRTTSARISSASAQRGQRGHPVDRLGHARAPCPGRARGPGR